MGEGAPDNLEHLLAVKALMRDPTDRVAALKAADYLDVGSPGDKQIAFLLYRYFYNFPDDAEVHSRFIAAQRSWFDRQLAVSEVCDTNYEKKAYRVTVLVSTWKAEDFVEECLGDLEAQTIA